MCANNHEGISLCEAVFFYLLLSSTLNTLTHTHPRKHTPAFAFELIPEV